LYFSATVQVAHLVSYSFALVRFVYKLIPSTCQDIVPFDLQHLFSYSAIPWIFNYCLWHKN